MVQDIGIAPVALDIRPVAPLPAIHPAADVRRARSAPLYLLHATLLI